MTAPKMYQGKPTLETLSTDVNTLHGCLEAHIIDTGKNFATVNGKLDVLVHNQAAMLAAHGVKPVIVDDENPPVPVVVKKTIGQMTPVQLGIRSAMFIGPLLPILFVLIKVIDAAWPSLVAGAHAAWDVLLQQ